MEKTDLKKCKKTLNILEIAATDKENLNSRVHRKKMSTSNPKPGLAKKNKKDAELNNRKLTQLKNKINKSETSVKPTTSELDLIVDNPSEGYWKNLAENYKKALDTALKENVDLHNKVNELEYENSRIKKMLDEAKTLVEILKEMVEERSDDSMSVSKDDIDLNENKDDSSLSESKDDNYFDESKDGTTSDKDSEDMSFLSCV